MKTEGFQPGKRWEIFSCMVALSIYSIGMLCEDEVYNLTDACMVALLSIYSIDIYVKMRCIGSLIQNVASWLYFIFTLSTDRISHWDLINYRGCYQDYIVY